MHTRKSYRAHWAVLTGKSPSEIYIPRALQPDRCFSCGWVRRTIPATETVDGPGNHRGCGEGQW